MKNNVIHIMFLFICSFCFSQQNVTWQDLSKIKFTDKYFSEYDDYFLYPTFSPSVKALDGKQIIIKGYFLNIGAEEKVYILSKGPMAACYFCGQGGPESAIELVFNNEPSFKTDAIVSIKGTLKLNGDDVNHFNYILKDCTALVVK